MYRKEKPNVIKVPIHPIGSCRVHCGLGGVAQAALHAGRVVNVVAFGAGPVARARSRRYRRASSSASTVWIETGRRTVWASPVGAWGLWGVALTAGIAAGVAKVATVGAHPVARPGTTGQAWVGSGSTSTLLGGVASLARLAECVVHVRTTSTVPVTGSSAWV